MLNKQKQKKNGEVAAVEVGGGDLVVAHEVHGHREEGVEHEAAGQEHVRGLVRAVVREERGDGEREHGDEERGGDGLAVVLVREEHGGGVRGEEVPGRDAGGLDAAVEEHGQHGEREEVAGVGERRGVAQGVPEVVHAGDEQGEEHERLRRPAARVEARVLAVLVRGVRVDEQALAGVGAHRLADDREVAQAQALVVHRHVEDARHRHARARGNVNSKARLPFYVGGVSRGDAAAQAPLPALQALAVDVRDHAPEEQVDQAEAEDLRVDDGRHGVRERVEVRVVDEDVLVRRKPVCYIGQHDRRHAGFEQVDTHARIRFF